MTNDIGIINCPVCKKEVSYYVTKDDGYFIRAHKADETDGDYPRPWCEADDITEYIKKGNAWMRFSPGISGIAWRIK